MNLFLTTEDIIKNHNETNPFSGAILVRDKDKRFERGYGYANRSERIKNSSYTRFGIASGCKIFTSVAICQLVQNRFLSFDSYLIDCLDYSFP